MQVSISPIQVAHDFLRGRAMYEQVHGKSHYPGALQNKAASALQDRETKNGDIDFSKRDGAFWKQFVGIGPTTAKELEDFFAR